jgi:hypothetical protein
MVNFGPVLDAITWWLPNFDEDDMQRDTLRVISLYELAVLQPLRTMEFLQLLQAEGVKGAAGA